MDFVSGYQSSVVALGAVAVLMFIQLLVADFIGIRNKHVPGSAIPSDHGLLLFRAARTVANTNESIGVFIAAFVFAVFSGAPPAWVAYSAWGFVVARAIYAVLYYANLQTLRSVSFAFVLLSIASLVGSGASRWL